MPVFVAKVASFEGIQRILVEAPTRAEAHMTLELDYGKGCVRGIEPYLADAAIDGEILERRDEAIYEYIRRNGKRRRFLQYRYLASGEYRSHIYTHAVISILGSLAVVGLFMALSQWLLFVFFTKIFDFSGF